MRQASNNRRSTAHFSRATLPGDAAGPPRAYRMYGFSEQGFHRCRSVRLSKYSAVISGDRNLQPLVERRIANKADITVIQSADG